MVQRFGIVTPGTLRRWEAEGRIEAPERTAGGQRRYDLAKLRHLAPRHAPSERVTLLYAKVSTAGQKDDLVRRVALLESFSAANGWAYEVIDDVGSKLNHQKKGLRQLIARICSKEVGRLVISHKDRLLRFGAELAFSLCEHFGTEVIIINASEDSSFEEDLANDVLEIVTVFSARLYGSRSHKNRQGMDELTKAAKQVAPRPDPCSGPHLCADKGPLPRHPSPYLHVVAPSEQATLPRLGKGPRSLPRGRQCPLGRPGSLRRRRLRKASEQRSPHVQAHAVGGHPQTDVGSRPLLGLLADGSYLEIGVESAKSPPDAPLPPLGRSRCNSDRSQGRRLILRNTRARPRHQRTTAR